MYSDIYENQIAPELVDSFAKFHGFGSHHVLMAMEEASHRARLGVISSFLCLIALCVWTLIATPIQSSYFFWGIWVVFFVHTFFASRLLLRRPLVEVCGLDGFCRDVVPFKACHKAIKELQDLLFVTCSLNNHERVNCLVRQLLTQKAVETTVSRSLMEKFSTENPEKCAFYAEEWKNRRKTFQRDWEFFRQFGLTLEQSWYFNEANRIIVVGELKTESQPVGNGALVHD